MLGKTHSSAIETKQHAEDSNGPNNPDYILELETLSSMAIISLGIELFSHLRGCGPALTSMLERRFLLPGDLLHTTHCHELVRGSSLCRYDRDKDVMVYLVPNSNGSIYA